MIKYDKLWLKAKEKGITNYALNTKYNISKSQLSRLRHNQNVNTHTINKLCIILECDVSDIMEFVPEDNE